MSEYQYYDFRAIDRPLSADQMKQLRGISSRAEITPVSFINQYNWGDLQANPRNLMRDYFDAHVYLANWGAAVLKLRLPKEVLDAKTLKVFAVDSYLDVDDLADYWLLTWSLGESEDYERFDDEEGGSWMTRLAPLREELLRGDLRSLYIGWLQAVTMEEDLTTEKEPMALEGLGNLTAAQQALAEFLAVDPDLLTGAGIGSPVESPGQVDPTALDPWLDKLPREEVRRYLQQMLTGQGAQAERTLRRSFAAWRSQATSENQTEMCRTVEELWQQAEQAQNERLARETEARSKAEAEKRQRREAWLTLLAKNLTAAWKKVHEEANRSCASGYDSACRQLVDLRDAYNLQGDPDTFKQEFLQFIAEHSRRKAFITRLEKAGLR
jgi:hypothetical protein